MVLGTNAAGETSSYTYNGFGYLVRNNNVDHIIDFTSAYQDVLAKYAGNDLVQLNVFGLDRISTNGIFIHNDRLGSGRVAADGQGNVVGVSHLDEWGNVLEKTDPHGVLNFFTNHEFDDVLGVYFAKARFYDPVDMRFLAIDPIKGFVIDPQTINSYIYVLNNPVIYF